MRAFSKPQRARRRIALFGAGVLSLTWLTVGCGAGRSSSNAETMRTGASSPHVHPVGEGRTMADPDRASSLRPIPIRAPLTLEQAVEAAIANNPELRAERARYEAMALEAPQVSSLPDPMVGYTQRFEGAQGRMGEVGVNQTFPWFGKRRLRGDIADAAARQALESLNEKALDLRREVAAAWHRLAYERAALRLTEEEKILAEQSLDAAAALYSSGQRGRDSLLKAQTELARIDHDRLAYPPRIAALEAELARLLHGDAAAKSTETREAAGESRAFDFSAADALEEILGAHMPDAETLIENALAIRPELAGIDHATHRADRRHELARKDAFPDPTFGLGYPIDMTGRGDRDLWSFSVGINIPVPNARRRAAREQALREREEAEFRRLVAEDRIRRDVETAIPNLLALDARRVVLRDRLAPLAEETLEVSRAGYESGTATFLDLLDAQRTYLAVRRDLLRANLDARLAVVELERAVGEPLLPTAMER